MWLVYALLSRVLWSGCSAADQLLTRRIHDRKIVSIAIMVFCACSLFCIPSAVLSGGLAWDMGAMGWAMGGYLASIIAVLSYYHCLKGEHAHNVVPYFEFTPVFVMLMAGLLLGEHMVPMQLLGAFIVVSCGFAFSWDFAHGKIKFPILGWMILSSLGYAVFQLCLKKAGEIENAWAVVCYVGMAQGVLGVSGLAFMPRVRRSIATSIRESRGGTIGLTLLTAGLSFLGLVSITLAFQQAPTAGHVAALSGTQPFFMFALAWVLGISVPRHFQRLRLDRETRFKLVMICGIALGVYLLAR